MKIKGLMINLWKHLSRKRKKQLFALTLVMIISGLVESFSIASIIPFLIGISNPNAIMNNKQIVQENHKIRLDYTLTNKECSYIDDLVLEKGENNKYKIINNKKMKYKDETLGFELAETFWHFLGFLWLYLFVFLYFFR